MSFCLKKQTCLPLSLCHSVLKEPPVSLRLSVILSSKPPHLLLLSSCYSVLKNYPVSSVLLLLCLKNHPICYLCLTLLPCLPYPVSPVLGYSVFQAEARGEESGKSFPAHGEL